VVTTLDSAGGPPVSIATGPDGRPWIAYGAQGGFRGLVKLARCGNNSCTSGNQSLTLDVTGSMFGTPTNTGDQRLRSMALAVPADGRPILAYVNKFAPYNTKVARCGNTDCTQGNSIVTLGGAGYPAQLQDMIVGATGLPVLLLVGDSGLAAFACTNPGCN
jgi:hypothetical protein